MPIKYQKRLLAHLGHDSYEPKPVDALAEELGEDDLADFTKAVHELEAMGLVAIDKHDRVSLPGLPDEGELVGEFRGTSRGFGFVRPEIKTDDGDVFIPPDATMGALSGDTVRVQYRRDFRRERREAGDDKSFNGEVVEIIRRKRANFTGEIDKRGDRWLAYPDGREINDPIIVRDAASKNVKPGDKVVLEILEYPEGGNLAEGVIVKVLGEAGEPDVETQAVIAAYSLPSNDFSDACTEQAREVTRRFNEEIERFEQEGESSLDVRADLTDRFVTTIDPPTAKDYDDAISIRKLSNDEGGGWELEVHIADVGHFIDQNTPLDVEALERGNSVYLPRLTIPMLPELLSNGICSLQEDVLRYAKTAIMRYDRRGNRTQTAVCSSVIRSRKRMTYLEAQALIDGNHAEAEKHAKTEPNYTPELVAAVREMNELARAIERRRHAAGMIHLDLPEVELIFNEDGRVIDAEPEDDAYTHKLIEMFMVEANECVAKLFEDLGVPLIRRVHPEPTPGPVDELRQTAKVAGFNIPKNPSREELQGLLDATRGTPAARAVHMAVLRTLTKAEYSPAQIGHFALASTAYAHFTSPIRRYPDLTAHRALKAYLERTDNGASPPRSEGEKKELGKKLRDDPRCPHEQELIEIGKQCSRTEQNAADAENELRSFLVLQLLADLLAKGENPEQPGVVTGVTPRGIFVQLERYLADGMIKREDLPGDTTRGGKPPKWRIDGRSGALVDENSGRSFSIGDRVRVSVAQVDLQRRQMDLVIVDAESRAAGKAKPVSGLTLGQGGGGLGESQGAGFKKMPGAQRRSAKSKRRDKGKQDYRDDRKGKGKRQ